ncbi:hypothetical protein [Salmonirosea aquatica]|uniref:Uncharacterized protein n=1 Tax=Salmonirosea aquatica TaxID=2654236 RepID=A0A7C9FAU5_9BACT|nr:hypothetical protein [Cytophagaceae bacterium SJW1-29]
MASNTITRTSVFLFIGILILSGHYPSGRIRYSHPPTLPLPVDTTVYHVLDFGDDIANDTLVQYLSKEGYPISYARHLRTGVCFDNKCRPLDITLRWNVTGRYLGFELPEKEFLSKYDHEPFTEKEYQRLHAILTDSLSALANFHYNEIVPKADSTYEKVDAVSGATSANVLEHVVEGAAFTTYKLWHLVYGTAKQKAETLTCQKLTPELIQLILNSSHLSDKLWALNHINGFIQPTPTLQRSVLACISDTNYNLTERALNSISPTDLKSDTLQAILVQKFLQTNYSTQKLLLAKLDEASPITERVRKELAKNLISFNGQLVSNILDLFLRHNITDAETCRRVSDLLLVENSFVSNKAYSFLTRINPEDAEVKGKLTKYHRLQK